MTVLVVLTGHVDRIAYKSDTLLKFLNPRHYRVIMCKLPKQCSIGFLSGLGCLPVPSQSVLTLIVLGTTDIYCLQSPTTALVIISVPVSSLKGNHVLQIICIPGLPCQAGSSPEKDRLHIKHCTMYNIIFVITQHIDKIIL